MQCVAVLRVSIMIKQIKKEHLQNLLVLSSLNHMHIYINIENFLGKKKHVGNLPPNAPPLAMGLCTLFSGKTRSFTLVPIMSP